MSQSHMKKSYTISSSHHLLMRNVTQVLIWFVFQQYSLRFPDGTTLVNIIQKSCSISCVNGWGYALYVLIDVLLVDRMFLSDTQHMCIRYKGMATAFSVPSVMS